MNRLIWWLLILAFLGSLCLAGSFAAAHVAVGRTLGDPPPDMGTSNIDLAWKGAPKLRGHPRAWVFRYRDTSIPGAPTVRIYVSLTGKLLATEPTDLPTKLRSFRSVD